MALRLEVKRKALIALCEFMRKGATQIRTVYAQRCNTHAHSVGFGYAPISAGLFLYISVCGKMLLFVGMYILHLFVRKHGYVH